MNCESLRKNSVTLHEARLQIRGCNILERIYIANCSKMIIYGTRSPYMAWELKPLKFFKAHAHSLIFNIEAPPNIVCYCSSKNGAYRDSNSELFLSSQALCRLVHSRPGHLLYVVQCIFICALRSLYSASQCQSITLLSSPLKFEILFTPMRTNVCTCTSMWYKIAVLTNWY